MKVMQASLEVIPNIYFHWDQVLCYNLQRLYINNQFLLAVMRMSYLHTSCGGATVRKEGAIGPFHLRKPERQGKTVTFREYIAQRK